jgi:integrase
MYLELRRRKWHALHDVPADVQAKLGTKRFCLSLQTSDRKIAEIRAVSLAADWKAKIEAARRGHNGPLEEAASFYRERLKEADAAGDDHGREVILDRIRDEAEERAIKAGRAAGTLDDHHIPDDPEATQFYKLATGQLVKTMDHLEPWLATLTANIPRTVAQKRSIVVRFAETFSYLQDVTRKGVQEWVDKPGRRPDTLKKNLSELRGYWEHLKTKAMVPEDAAPFDKITLPRLPRKGHDALARKPFEPDDVVRLVAEAEKRGLDTLADLIRMGMWTGARISELCFLQVGDVHRGWFQVRDGKTKAAVRKVPIHSKLKPVLARLTKDRESGYVLADLPSNKFGDRSGAIGHAFSRLKEDLGFGPAQVFHSIRKTMITQLENAHVPENIVADIVGHEKPRITYGLYSGGASVEVMQDAIEKLTYPAPAKAKTKTPTSRSRSGK